MNLHEGQGDSMTLHAGCPVLHGSKWVANLWVHEKGNYPFVAPADAPEADD